MKLYSAGSICSSMRSTIPARLISTVVWNLWVFMYSQDNGERFASLATLFTPASGDKDMSLADSRTVRCKPCTSPRSQAEVCVPGDAESAGDCCKCAYRMLKCCCGY